jgi:hypothetical protein
MTPEETTAWATTPYWSRRAYSAGETAHAPMPTEAETAAEFDALLPAILDRAFRGEL